MSVLILTSVASGCTCATKMRFATTQLVGDKIISNIFQFNNFHYFIGQYECECFDGFRPDATDEIKGTHCYNIDECEEGTHNCHEFTMLTHLITSLCTDTTSGQIFSHSITC